MTQTKDFSVTFQENKYFVLKSFVTEPLLTVLYKYVLMKAKTGKTVNGDDQVAETPVFEYDLLMETLLEEVRSKIELAIDKKLYPTYSCGRIYKRGDILERHKDRPACEVSLTLTLGSDGSTRWPFYVNSEKVTSEIHLDAGDALVYRGCEVEHWRESFDGEHQVQVFLHYYVEQNGPNAEWKFDRRPQLGINRQLTFQDVMEYMQYLVLQLQIKIKRYGIFRKRK